MLTPLSFQQEVTSLVASEADDRGLVDSTRHGTYHLLLGVAGRVSLSCLLVSSFGVWYISGCFYHYGNRTALVTEGGNSLESHATEQSQEHFIVQNSKSV